LKGYQRDRSLPDPNLEPTITITRAGLILGMGRTAAHAAPGTAASRASRSARPESS
jgi:hypothetical protein